MNENVAIDFRQKKTLNPPSSTKAEDCHANTIAGFCRIIQKTAKGILRTESESYCPMDSGKHYTNRLLLKKIDQCDQQAENLLGRINMLKKTINQWCVRVLIWEGLSVLSLVMVFGLTSLLLGYWQNNSLSIPWLSDALHRPILLIIVSVLSVLLVIALHFSLRRTIANNIKSELNSDASSKELIQAFERSTSVWRSVFRPHPVGWHWWQQWQLKQTRANMMQMRTLLGTEHEN